MNDDQIRAFRDEIDNLQISIDQAKTLREAVLWGLLRIERALIRSQTRLLIECTKPDHKTTEALLNLLDEQLDQAADRAEKLHAMIWKDREPGRSAEQESGSRHES